MTRDQEIRDMLGDSPLSQHEERELGAALSREKVPVTEWLETYWGHRLPPQPEDWRIISETCVPIGGGAYPRAVMFQGSAGAVNTKSVSIRAFLADRDYPSPLSAHMLDIAVLNGQIDLTVSFILPWAGTYDYEIYNLNPDNAEGFRQSKAQLLLAS